MLKTQPRTQLFGVVVGGQSNKNSKHCRGEGTPIQVAEVHGDAENEVGRAGTEAQRKQCALLREGQQGISRQLLRF